MGRGKESQRTDSQVGREKRVPKNMFFNRVMVLRLNPKCPNSLDPP